MAKFKDGIVTVTVSPAQMSAIDSREAELADWFETALRGIGDLRNGLPLGDRAERLLQDTSALIGRLEGVRAAALRQYTADGASVGRCGIAMGTPKATAQSRRTALARGSEPAELWARREHGATNHPGAPVPDALRSWSTWWPGYTPVDITPAELRPAGLRKAVAEGWAEGYASPYDVPVDELLARSRTALLPYDLDDRMWPLNPTGRTGRTGRNLGKWGENTAADPIVIAGTGADRRILLIERDDVMQWGFPGGMVEPGELAKAALVRELCEETGVDLAGLAPKVLGTRYVEDWRNTDHAWVVTTAAVFALPNEVTVTAADDAADAGWFPFADLATLEAALAEQGQELYPAHRPLLELALTHLTTDADERRNTTTTKENTTMGKKQDSTDADMRQPGESSADYARRIHPELFDGTSNRRSSGTVVNINNGGTVGYQTGGDVTNRTVII